MNEAVLTTIARQFDRPCAADDELICGPCREVAERVVSALNEAFYDITYVGPGDAPK